MNKPTLEELNWMYNIANMDRIPRQDYHKYTSMLGEFGKYLVANAIDVAQYVEALTKSMNEPIELVPSLDSSELDDE